MAVYGYVTTLTNQATIQGSGIAQSLPGPSARGNSVQQLSICYALCKVGTWKEGTRNELRLEIRVTSGEKLSSAPVYLNYIFRFIVCMVDPGRREQIDKGPSLHQ